MEAVPKIYTLQNIEAYGNRLYFNTIFNLLLNGFAVFLILKYSTKAMGVYKYFILSSVIASFVLDFHSTFIMGIFLVLPTPIICAAGLARSWGWLWGEVVNILIMEYTFTATGMSIFFGFFYQYYSLLKNAAVFRELKTIIAMVTFTLIYPTPLVIITALNIHREAAVDYVNANFPFAAEIFVQGSCNMNLPGIKQKLWFLAAFIQISLIYGAMIYLGWKINKRLKEFKHSMSHRSFKARRQLLIALIIQMTVPLIFIVIPVAFLYICIVLEISDIGDLSQWVLQFFGLHSCGNALTIMAIIKPYRSAIINGFTSFKRTLLRQPSEAPSTTLFSYTASPVVISATKTSRMYNRFSL